MASQSDFQATCDRLADHLGSDDAKAQAAAAVTVALMLQSEASAPYAPSADLGRLSTAFCNLIESGDAAVKRNAAAALSASLECNDSAVQAAIESRAAERAVVELEAQATRPPAERDAGLQLNLLVLLGALGEAAEATAQLVLDAGGLQQLLAAADPAASQQLQEAAADGLCKLVSGSAVAKEAAAGAGVIPRMAALLGAPSDITVRALLCLGMLVGGSPERQLQLANAPGAVPALLRLMRQQDDADCQQIAAGLFKELASDSGAKEALAAALKAQQAADAAGARFVG
ncbi:hypothetical protein ABPG75_013546 [Micractinium tetrahymenae]